MPKITTNYKLSALLNSDVWYPDIDQLNMQIIENLLKSAEFFMSDGIVKFDYCNILSLSPPQYQKQFYSAAFNYYDDLYFNLVKYDLHYIGSQDVIADRIIGVNVDINNIYTNGLNLIPGQQIFLTNQNTASENGIYLLSIYGATKISVSGKIFINGNDSTYPNTIWLFNSVTGLSLNAYSCMLVVDGLIAIQNSKAITTNLPCFLRPSLGKTNLVCYATNKHYGTGLPILYTTSNPKLKSIVLSTFSNSSTAFSDYNLISNLTITSNSNFLTDFNKQTINQRPTYKNLHNHANVKSKLGLTDFIKLTLVATSNFSNACRAFDKNQNLYNFNTSSQSIRKVFINGNSIDPSLISYNDSSRLFIFSFPVSNTDEIYLIVDQSKSVKLIPLKNTNNSTDSYVISGSNGSIAYTWSLTDYDNFSLDINGSQIAQQSYSVDNTTGQVSIVNPNVSNLPINSSTLTNSVLRISSSSSDLSSFFGNNSHVNQLNASLLSNKISYRGKHNQFDIQTSRSGFQLNPLIQITPSTYQIPYKNISDFQKLQITQPITDAICGTNSALINASNTLYALIDNELKVLFSELSDFYFNVIKIYKIQNSNNIYYALLSSSAPSPATDNQYVLLKIDLENDVFDSQEFTFNGVINDFCGFEYNSITKLFYASDTGIYTIDFTNIDPIFNKVYYHLSASGSELYSYLPHNISKIAISSIKDQYEIYGIIQNFPSSQQSVFSVNSQKVIKTDSSVGLFEISNNNGISNNGIIYGNSTSTQISTAPYQYQNQNYFPFTYGNNLTTSSAPISCYTCSIAYIDNFNSVPISLLDGQSPSVNDYILVKQQANNSQNGIYKVQSISLPNLVLVPVIIDNLAIGNYITVLHGTKCDQTVWELSYLSDIANQKYIYKLQYSYNSINLLNMNKCFSDGTQNSIYLSNNSSVNILYDSSYTSQNIYKHVLSTTSTSAEIFAANALINLIITKNSFTAENYTQSLNQIQYTYPLSQGQIAYISSNQNWILNQLINISYAGTNSQASIINKNGNIYTIQIVSSQSASLGLSTCQSYNFTFLNFIDNLYFKQNWFDGIWTTTTGSPYMLSPSQYTHDYFNNLIILQDSSIFGYPVYAYDIDQSNNLRVDSDNKFTLNNSNPNNYNQTPIAEYNQTLSQSFSIDHDSNTAQLSTSTPVLINNKGSTSNSVNDFYGVVQSASGSQYATIINSSVSKANLNNQLVFESEVKKSNSIESRLLNKNQFSSSILSNSILLNKNLNSFTGSYQPIVGPSIENILIDSQDSSTYDNDTSDFYSGVSNYEYDGNFNISNESVYAFFYSNNIKYAVISGKIVTINNPIIIASLDFQICFFASTTSQYIILGTDNGVYILDHNFNLKFKAIQSNNVRAIFEINDNELLIAAENTICYMNLLTFSYDFLALPVNSINCIRLINGRNDSIYLVGTTDGLYAVTLNAKTSQQILLKNNFIGAKFISLNTEDIPQIETISKNNVIPIYSNLENISDENLISHQGQPNIHSIFAFNANVYVATDNGIFLYDSLNTIDLLSPNISNIQLNPIRTVIYGLMINKIIYTQDVTNGFSVYIISTNDGVYYSFDQLSSLMKSNIQSACFDSIIDQGVWYVATNTGLLTSADQGYSFNKTILPRGSLVNSSQPNSIIFRALKNFSCSTIIFPIYALNANYNINISVATANYITGLPDQTLATASVSKTLLNGFYNLKFNLSSSVNLNQNQDYVITVSNSINSNLYLCSSNKHNNLFDILNTNINGNNIDFEPAIKFGSNNQISKFTGSTTLSLNNILNSSNVQLNASGSFVSYPAIELNFIIDNSNSIFSYANNSDINNFISSINTVVGAKCKLLSSNTILTDTLLTGFNNLATGSLYYSSTSNLSRINDAINVTEVRSDHSCTAPPTIGPSGFNNYINDSIANNTTGFVLKKILNANSFINKYNIYSKYSEQIFTGTAYTLLQNGFSGSIAGSTYAFVNNTYIYPSQYSISNSSILINTGSLGVTKDFELINNNFPAINSPSDLNNTQFNSLWSTYISADQSKINIILTDNIDNNSASDINDYLALNKNNNTLTIFCSLNSFNQEYLHPKFVDGFCIAKQNSESMSSFTTKVINFITKLNHSVFGMKLSLKLDKEINSVNITHTFPSLVAKFKQNDDIISVQDIISNTSVPAPDVDNKYLELYSSSTGSINNIVLNYSYDSNFIFTRNNSTLTSYNNELLISNLSNSLGKNNLNWFAPTGSYNINYNKSSWLTNSRGILGFSPSSAIASSTGPHLTRSVSLSPSEINGFNKYTIAGDKHIPPQSAIISSTGPCWYDWKNNSVYISSGQSISSIDIYSSPLLILNIEQQYLNSISKSIIDWNKFLTLQQNNPFINLDSNRNYKIFQNSESYAKPVPGSMLNVSAIGSISSSKIKSQLIKYPYSATQKVYTPTLPSLNLQNPSITKYKNYNVSLFGFSANKLYPGRKLTQTSSGSWLFGSTAYNTYTLYTGSIFGITNLLYSSSNTFSENASLNYNSISQFDGNYSPDIINASTLINGVALQNTAGTNDVLTISVLVNRNDTPQSQPYVYSFNTGDQIILNIQWNHVTQASSTILSTGNSLTISPDVSALGGYVYATIAASRGLTKGTSIATIPIYLS